MKIQSVKFSPVTLSVGDVLQVQITLLNDSTVGVASQQPYSSATAPYVYNVEDDFRSNGFVAQNGVWMALAHWYPGPITFPYRLGWQGVVPPKGIVTVTGGIKMNLPGGFLFDGGTIRPGTPDGVQGLGQTLIVVNMPGGGGGTDPRVDTLITEMGQVGNALAEHGLELDNLQAWRAAMRQANQ